MVAPAKLRHLLLRDVGPEKELVRVACGHRLAVEEALHVFAAELLELESVGFRLGTLRDDIHAEIMGERDDRAQDDTAVAGAAAAHEGLIDLDGIEGKALQVGERGITRAEIVERQAGAEL